MRNWAAPSKTRLAHYERWTTSCILLGMKSSFARFSENATTWNLREPQDAQHPGWGASKTAFPRRTVTPLGLACGSCWSPGSAKAYPLIFVGSISWYVLHQFDLAPPGRPALDAWCACISISNRILVKLYANIEPVYLLIRAGPTWYV